MAPKKNQRPNAIDEDEELDTQIDPSEEEDVPFEEEGERPKKKGNDKGKDKADKGKGRAAPDDEDDEDDDRLRAAEGENRALHEELAQIRRLFEQHRRETDRAARPSATSGAGSSNANRSSNTTSAHSHPRERPPNAHTAASGGPNNRNSLDDNRQADNNSNHNDSEIRIPPPARKETLTIKAIQDHLGLTNSREDHLRWLEWRENIRSWSSMANLDYDLSWKQQDKGRIGTLVTMIRDRIPAFRRFVNNWAAEYLVQDYFNHRRGHRMAKARDDSSSPPKKKRRGNTTKMGGNQAEASSKQAATTPEYEDQGRRHAPSGPRPVARPPPPPEDDATRDHGAAGDEDEDVHNNDRNDPPAISPSKNKRGGDTGGNLPRDRAGPTNNRTPGRGGNPRGAGRGAGRGGGRGGGGPAQGRGLNIQMNTGPPPSMSTRSRARRGGAPNSASPAGMDEEPEGDVDE